jgi:hypothetical protein
VNSLYSSTFFDEVDGLNPPIMYFSKYLENDNDISFATSFENKILSLVPMELVDSVAKCHPRIFICEAFGDESFLKSNIDAFHSHLIQRGVRVFSFRKVETYRSNLESIFKIHRTEFVDETYILKIRSHEKSRRRGRMLETGISSGLQFRRVRVDSENIDRISEFLISHAQSLGLPHLSLQRYKFLVTYMPFHFELVEVIDVNHSLVAAAFTQRVGDHLRVPTYFSNRESKGAVDVLIDGLIGIAQLEGLEFLDLGTCTDPNTGELVDGIRKFKTELGCSGYRILNCFIDLNHNPN